MPLPESETENAGAVSHFTLPLAEGQPPKPYNCVAPIPHASRAHSQSLSTPPPRAIIHPIARVEHAHLIGPLPHGERVRHSGGEADVNQQFPTRDLQVHAP